MERISPHLTYAEATRSHTAIRYGLNNTPGPAQLENMKEWALNIFEPTRAALGGYPIHLASFFRCYDLNELIGGAIGSQHLCIKGAAGDMDNDLQTDGPSNLAIFYYILENLEFDQLIYEFGDDRGPAWVHASYNKMHNRRQVLRAIKVANLTKYIDYA